MLVIGLASLLLCLPWLLDVLYSVLAFAGAAVGAVLPVAAAISVKRTNSRDGRVRS